MTEQMIRGLTELYVKEGLPDALEDELWVEFLRDIRHYDTYLLMESYHQKRSGKSQCKVR